MGIGGWTDDYQLGRRASLELHQQYTSIIHWERCNEIYWIHLMHAILRAIYHLALSSDKRTYSRVDCANLRTITNQRRRISQEAENVRQYEELAYCRSLGFRSIYKHEASEGRHEQLHSR
jgi:hypothetical protein